MPARSKLSPEARQRLILRWTRIYMVGIYVATLGVAVVITLATNDHLDLPAFALCMLGLSFPIVAGTRGTATMPELPPLSPGQMRRLKQLWALTVVLVFACIVCFEARTAGPPVALAVVTVAAGASSGLYGLWVLCS